jgi:hypothetical protein
MERITKVTPKKSSLPTPLLTLALLLRPPPPAVRSQIGRQGTDETTVRPLRCGGLIKHFVGITSITEPGSFVFAHLLINRRDSYIDKFAYMYTCQQ